jgi:heme exporter protein A
VNGTSSEPRLSLTSIACGAGHRTLFEDLSITLVAGQWAALRGHNGSGKSTLLRCVAGLSSPLRGDVFTRGGLLYQSHYSGWKENFTPTENLLWQGQLEGGRSAADIDRALLRVGIQEQAQLSFLRLSAGQKRRVSLARLTLSRAKVWLLDEPTTALDQQGQNLFAEILTEHLARGGVGLIATHQDIARLSAQFTIDLGAA